MLGVDWGTVRIGLALGEAASGLVVALPVLDHPGDEAAAVRRVAEAARGREVDRVVVGRPLHKSGAENPMSRMTARVRDALAALLGPAVEVVLEDERYTSVDAEDRFREAGLRWWQVPKGAVDAAAAISLVRAHLERLDPRLALLAAQAPDPEDPAPDGPGPTPDAARDRRAARRAHQRRRPRGG